MRADEVLISADPGVGDCGLWCSGTQSTLFSVAPSDHLSNLVGERRAGLRAFFLPITSLNVMLE
jgi:hypothetical protein